MYNKPRLCYDLFRGFWNTVVLYIQTTNDRLVGRNLGLRMHDRLFSLSSSRPMFTKYAFFVLHMILGKPLLPPTHEIRCHLLNIHFHRGAVVDCSIDVICETRYVVVEGVMWTGWCRLVTGRWMQMLLVDITFFRRRFSPSIETVAFRAVETLDCKWLRNYMYPSYFHNHKFARLRNIYVRIYPSRVHTRI